MRAPRGGERRRGREERAWNLCTSLGSGPACPRGNGSAGSEAVPPHFAFDVLLRFTTSSSKGLKVGSFLKGRQVLWMALDAPRPLTGSSRASYFWARGVIKMPFWLQKGESAPWGVVVSWLASLACHPEEQLQKGKRRGEIIWSSEVLALRAKQCCVGKWEWEMGKEEKREKGKRKRKNKKKEKEKEREKERKGKKPSIKMWGCSPGNWAIVDLLSVSPLSELAILVSRSDQMSPTVSVHL